VFKQLKQDIASSIFVGRFRRGLKPFFVAEKPFPEHGTDLKTIATWRYDWLTSNREKFQNVRKLMQNL